MFGLPAGASGGIGVMFSRDRGAVVMPGINGADRTDTSNKAIFSDYASQHGESWYRFANGTLGREADNGELYLITGFDKSNSWENAVIYNHSATNSCTLAFTTGPGIGVEGRLRLSKTTSDKSSLSQRCSSDETLHNQSLFVRGFRISVRQGMRARFGTRIKIISTYKSSQGEILDKDKSGGIPFGGSTSSGFSGSNDSSRSPGAASFLSSRDSSAGISGGESDTQSREEDDFTPDSKMYHPLIAINDHILNTREDVTLVVTHDDDWISLLDNTQDKGIMPGDSTLIKRLQDRMSVLVNGKGHAKVIANTAPLGEATATSPEPSLKKRGRGRPKGSKNKLVKSYPSAATAGTSSQVNIPRKRERTPEERKAADSGDSDPPPVKKRGRRHRPPKKKLEMSPEGDSPAGADEGEPKRKRRPKSTS
ncbi:hypothetical protein AAF712_010142 [Marasmius tenuissimus]|uniref:Uncharacterized protein n=1 Tax=Marasmius tenuissimus TaxID=585030 RepID=A0ABR2ZN60_9AGAR